MSNRSPDNTGLYYRHRNKNYPNVPVQHGWNSDFESVVKGIGEESRAYAWMNKESGNHRKWLDDIHDIAAMSLSAVAVLIQTISSFASNPTLLLILNIIGPVLSALVSMILGIRKHYGWNAIYPLNQLMYRKFTILSNQCTMILKLRRNHRQCPGSVFTESVNKKYTKLIQSEENNVLEKHRNKFMIMIYVLLRHAYIPIFYSPFCSNMIWCVF